MLQVILIIILSLFICYAGLIVYYRTGWNRLPCYTIADNAPQTKITVIIPARNEAANIGNCLNSLLLQSYSKQLFEVLVVDDFSEDNTAAIVQDYASENIRLISLKDFIKPGEINSYKKKAIEIAVQHSAGELIVTTDADCTVPQNWLHTIAVFYEEKKPAFIAMPVLIQPTSSFIGIFQSLDFMTLQGITGASVHNRFHSMCNGANLAYTKKAFEAVNGFKGIDTVASGDDMLLMHKIYKHNPEKVLFLKSKEVIVHTQPVHSVSAFFNQRIRWASKADKYDDKRIFAVLLLVYLFNVLMLLLPAVAVFKNYSLPITNYPLSIIHYWLLLLFLKTLIELWFLFPVAGFFNVQRILWWFPFMQPFHIAYTVIAGWLGKFGSYNWKDRKVT
jgi:cellulose synthase/poly-beta-1,6-N-acetylglucosamine synthase-like glycosyltransferase